MSEMERYPELTKEMVENTKSFYEVCMEDNWRKAIEKREQFFNWFYDNDFIPTPKEPTELLTEEDIIFISNSVSLGFWKALGQPKHVDWFSFGYYDSLQETKTEVKTE